MKKLLLSAFLLILSFSFANADSIKIGSGKYDADQGTYESDMLEVTYSFSANNDYGLEPIVGALKTDADAFMVYAGVKRDFKLGRFVISPSFAPGYYDDGDGKKLGYHLEFKSQIDVGFEIVDGWVLTYALSHISNASLGSTNPGADNQMIFLAKNF